MKYIDDDMDELFNKAGRQYPLKTEPKNWDAVHGALHPDQAAAPATQKKNGFRRYLPLLLLLLIPAVYVVIERDGIAKSNNQANNQTNNQSNDLSSDQANLKKETAKNATTNKEEINQEITNKEITLQPSTKEITPQPETVGIVDKKRDREVKQLSYAPPAEQSLSESKDVTQKPGYVKGGLSGPPQAGKQPKLSLPLTGMNTLTRANNTNSGIAGWNTFPPLSAGTASLSLPSKDIVMDKPLRQLGGQNESTSVPYIDKKKPSGKIGFYYGISGAPDVSRIKGQDVKGTGYSAGVIAGYQLNLHWSVEGGVLWSNKRYFTKGKYFSKAGAGIPSNINLRWLDGGCDMLEFPVLVRYDFSPKKNTFFGTVGLTSYMMKKEDYTYGADAGAGQNYYEGYRQYHRSGDHLFSNLQLSAGYKFSLSSKMNMRIEPYLKTPLKKIGIGKMPITSAGLTFSLMRDFR